MTVRPRVAPRPSVSPTHFADVTLEGLTLNDVIAHYLDWVEGRGKRAGRRAKQGVPQPLPRASLLGNHGTTLQCANGTEIAVRIDASRFVLRFIHKDDRHPGVSWYSVVRATEHAHAVRIEHGTGRTLPPYLRLPPVAGAPSVLEELLQRKGVRPHSPDLATPNVVRIRSGEAERFVNHIVLSAKRTLPLLLLSETKRRSELLVDAKKLSRLLHTQAIVAHIDTNATWEFAEAFEKRGFPREFGNCFDGAARLYHPRIEADQDVREHFLWLQYRLRDAANPTEVLAGEVAERVSWRALPTRFFSALEDADLARRRDDTRRVLEEGVERIGDFEQRTEALEAHVQRLRGELEATQQDMELWRAEVERLESERRVDHSLLEQAEQERDDALAKYAPAEARLQSLEARESSNSLSSVQLEAVRQLVQNGAVQSVATALQVLEALYGERVAILPSAWAAAEEGSSFRKPDKVWALLRTLATDYWQVRQSQGDGAAKKCFGNAVFASRESETVEKNKAARERRTFRHNGEDITMWKHLKIGTKDSVADTWRCHFHYDDDSKKLVIGHCGKHLDFK